MSGVQILNLGMPLTRPQLFWMQLSCHLQKVMMSPFPKGFPHLKRRTRKILTNRYCAGLNTQLSPPAIYNRGATLVSD